MKAVVRTRSRRGSRWAELVLGGLLSVVALVLLASPAGAHPLGNFTVNRYARVEVSAGQLRVYYVLDEAEIPAFEDRAALRTAPSAFLAARAEAIKSGLRASVDGLPVELTVARQELTEPAGQAGLHTLRVSVLFEGALALVPGSAHDAAFADLNEPSRIGWREIVVLTRADTALVSSSAPAGDASDELRRYPANLIQSPLDLRSARFRFLAGATTAPPVPAGPAAAAPRRAGGRFAALITRSNVTPGVLSGMLALALLFGAGHALAPGHGKTVMAAYLVGTRGRQRDAVYLGAIVALMHTASVLVLGVALFQLQRSAAPERLYPWLTLATGIAVAAYGCFLVRTRMAGLGHAHLHRHRRQGHQHDEHDEHDEHDGHPHRHPEVAPLSRRGLVVLAAAGGLFPSPTALLVLVASFSLKRAALGLGLIAAFSVGLAVTLTGVGLALVYGRRAVERRRLLPALRLLPMGSALAMTVLGLVFAVKGASGLA